MGRGEKDGAADMGQWFPHQKLPEQLPFLRRHVESPIGLLAKRE